MGRIFYVIVVNISICCTLIVGLEGAGQITHYLNNGKFVFEDNEDPDSYKSHLNRLFELHPYLVGRPSKAVTLERNGYVFKTTRRNTRWTGAPENDESLVRIAVLGGSSTYGTGVSDKNSWPALLQKKLGDGFSVINYGVPGYSTAEAIIQLALVVPEAKPHFIIHYQGWNDIRNYHEKGLGADYFGHGMKQYGNLAIPTYQKQTVLEKLEGVSAIVKYTHDIKQIISPEPEKNDPEIFSTPDPFVDRIFVRNLKTIKKLTDNLSSVSIYVPQLLNYHDFLKNEGSSEWTPHIDNKAMPDLMNRFNSLMQSVCPKDDTHCVFVRQVQEEQWDVQDFVDNGHLSRKGGEKFAEILRQLIVDKVKDGHPETLVQ